MARAERQVVPGDGGGWFVQRDGTVSSFHLTFEQAEARAREIVNQLGGGKVVILRSNGAVKRRQAVAPTEKYFG